MELPDITAILMGVSTAKTSRGQALEWIQEHIALAVGEAADRDMFAATAMQALYEQDTWRHDGEPATYDKIAADAYRMADAMKRARGV